MSGREICNVFHHMPVHSTALSPSDCELYRCYTIGLCRCIQQRHEALSCLTMSAEMTFPLVLLCSLYEPVEVNGEGRRLPPPLKRRGYLSSEICEYCADMTVVLTRLRYQDGRLGGNDDRDETGLAALAGPYRRVLALRKDKVNRIEELCNALKQAETDGCRYLGVPMNLAAQLLGEIFAYREDAYESDLRLLGESLGRFLYFADAYNDLKTGAGNGRYNVLRSLRLDEQSFERFCERTLALLTEECARCFEALPLKRHRSILRNVLYSGIWMQYWRNWSATGQTLKRIGEAEHEHKPI